MRLSIVMATRRDKDLLHKCIKSLNDKAKGAVELILGMDYDAVVPVDRSKYNNLSIITVLREQSDNMTEDYYNMLARVTSGDMIMPFTDDATMLTRHYDLILEKALKPYPMFLGDTKNNMRRKDEPFASFPVISRQSVELLGWFMFPYFRAWDTDKLTYSIYKQAGLVVDCQKVVIRHNWGVEDEAHVKMKRVYAEDVSGKGCAPVVVTKEVQMLRKYSSLINKSNGSV